MTPIRLLLGVTLPLFVLDQLTKWATLAYIPYHGEIPVIPGVFNLVHVVNTGSAFGMMRGWFSFHIALAIIVGIFVLWTLFRRSTDRVSRLACALLLAGIFGNVTDRLIHGHVIDFLDFYVGNNHWPAFNIADSAIVVSVAIFLWTSFRKPQSSHSPSA